MNSILLPKFEWIKFEQIYVTEFGAEISKKKKITGNCKWLVISCAIFEIFKRICEFVTFQILCERLYDKIWNAKIVMIKKILCKSASKYN
jgi:hypothetical protein